MHFQNSAGCKTAHSVSPLSSLPLVIFCWSVDVIVSHHNRLIGSVLIAPISPALIPQQLRLHINPSIRRVFINSAKGDSSSSMSNTSSTSEDELARLRAENRNLRTQCVMWRRRAELHGAATLGLLDFARILRDKASSLSRERDELETRCYALKRQLDEEECVFLLHFILCRLLTPIPTLQLCAGGSTFPTSPPR